MTKGTEQIIGEFDLQKIFMPTTMRLRDEYFKGLPSAKFVHYTTAEAALKIIQSKRLWMRNTKCMSDYKEIVHGISILNEYFFGTQLQDEFTQALDLCHHGLATNAIDYFSSALGVAEHHTYIASISEHDEEREGRLGRLSMWRAFGGSAARVALVFNVPWESKAADTLNISAFPVIYGDEKTVEEEFSLIINNVRVHKGLLKTIDRTRFYNWVMNLLVSMVVGVKHAGFSEEREWRIIYGVQEASPLIKPTTQTINGVPQLIYELPLDKNIDPQLEDLDFSHIFDHLIIGPSPYSIPMFMAFNEALRTGGVSDSDKKIFFSNIPIRN